MNRQVGHDSRTSPSPRPGANWVPTADLAGVPILRSAAIEIDALSGLVRSPGDPDLSPTAERQLLGHRHRSRPVTALPKYGSAVDAEHLAVDPLPVFGCQERHHCRDVLGRSEAGATAHPEDLFAEFCA